MENLVSYGVLSPPTIFILLNLVGVSIALAWRRTGLAIALGSSLCLYAAATPALSSYLLRHIEAALPDEADLKTADAIVVLGGDVKVAKDANVADQLGTLSLERLIFAVDAYRELHKPIAVSGGTIAESSVSIADLMKSTLEGTFGVPVTWVEGESGTTWENAAFSARLLQPAGIKTVLLVSQSWHLPRAEWSFERVGFKVLPWSVPRTAAQWDEFNDYLPNIGALQTTFYALHEIFGLAYYRLRH